LNMLQINEETCTQCGICATVCSFGLIEIEGDNYPEEVPEADQFCNRCGACVAACPEKALISKLSCHL